MNTNFKDIDLIRVGIKLKSTAPEADALTTQPSELSQKIAFLQNEVFPNVMDSLLLLQAFLN